MTIESKRGRRLCSVEGCGVNELKHAKRNLRLSEDPICAETFGAPGEDNADTCASFVRVT